MSSFFETIKPAKGKRKEGEAIWLLAFADLTTNLMALFILMLSMSTVSASKFDAVAKEVTKQRTDSLDELKEKIDAEIKKNKLEKIVSTELGMFGLNVEFMNGVMFDSASANLSKFALKDAQIILGILAKSDSKYKLALEGHTDDMPIKFSKKYSDNWQLSTARAVALLNLIKEMGVPENRMNVSGFAATRPKIAIDTKLAAKNSLELESARASNRRVTVRVYQ